MEHKLIYLDGAMGTMLQKNGLTPGRHPETLCLTDPGAVTAIHRAYIDAGAQVIYANTFGANRYKLERSGATVERVIHAAVRCAQEAARGTETKVALDVGPIGQLLEPYGTLRFEDAYEIFREMITAGAAAGAQLIIMETMTDLYEAKAAVLAAKEHTDLPVYVTMTFEENGRTFTGCSVEAMAAALEGLGVDALGVNCSLGPRELRPVVERLCSATRLPVIVKANAGLPDPETGTYGVRPEEFAAWMNQYVDMGVTMLGGCCGTTPAYIREIVLQTADRTPAPREVFRESLVCTPTSLVRIDGVRIIGERINPTGKKRFRQALLEDDMDYIQRQAIEQADAGAHILDVNVGLPEVDEPEMMARVVKAIQSVTDLPLQIDSSNPAAIEAGLRAVNGKAIVNSVNGEQAVLDRILPIARKYGAAVVGLTMDQNGIPPKAEQRFALAKRILRAAQAYGIAKEDVFIDCLTLTVATEQDKAMETLRAVQLVRDQLGLHCVLGVSNISFGLPYRDRMTAGFLTLAMAHGLDLPILNPNSEEVMNAVRVFRVLSNRDRNAEEYLAACLSTSEEKKQEKIAEPDEEQDEQALMHAVSKGLREDAARLAQKLLDGGMNELDIINGLLIPALDRTGERFEQGRIFLPQLMNSASAAQEAFERIQASLAKRGVESVSRGKVLIATVKGDIHDIGKNIVRTILKNYGYQVIDLGRDVEIAAIVDTAIRQDVRLIGLSALMTTTLDSMEQTIRALRKSGHACKIWVGGAVLTPEYAERMGADFYARDAKESVDIAKKVLG